MLDLPVMERRLPLNLCIHSPSLHYYISTGIISSATIWSGQEIDYKQAFPNCGCMGVGHPSQTSRGQTCLLRTLNLASFPDTARELNGQHVIQLRNSYQTVYNPIITFSPFWQLSSRTSLKKYIPYCPEQAQLKRQNLRVGGYTENSLKWYGYPRAKVRRFKGSKGYHCTDPEGMANTQITHR